MNNYILLLNFVFVSTFIFAQADPYSGSVYGYLYSTPVNTTQDVSFDLGNGAAASRAIIANSVEWTLNFPLNQVNLVSVGNCNCANTPFYEYSRRATSTTLIVLIRSSTIPQPGTDPSTTEFTISFPVTGLVAENQGTMSINNRVLQGYNGTVGNLDPTNDNASSPIFFTPVFPVKLSKFNATRVESMVILDWASEKETNFSHFEIERSSDGSVFSYIGRVEGNSVESAYSHLDREPFSGVNYYRLKMVDTDKTYVYSHIKAVDMGSKIAGEVSIYPNPFNNGFTLEGLEKGASIKVYNSNGGLIYNQITNDAVLRAELPMVSHGLYNVTVEQNGKLIHKKMVKMD
jgi:hypothetical protein